MPPKDTIQDNPGVIAPPPLIGLAVIVGGLLLDWLLPAYVLTVLLLAGFVVRAIAPKASGIPFVKDR